MPFRYLNCRSFDHRAVPHYHALFAAAVICITGSRDERCRNLSSRSYLRGSSGRSRKITVFVPRSDRGAGFESPALQGWANVWRAALRASFRIGILALAQGMSDICLFWLDQKSPAEERQGGGLSVQRLRGREMLLLVSARFGGINTHTHTIQPAAARLGLRRLWIPLYERAQFTHACVFLA